ncbi:2-keto-4-pentenoate hydratase [Kitasatospora sp. KL5]|uniref:2-keto-4-pentenoate hydratase n=1 Tax=Kitasatospora sp. KL5 TaxID=3425125 RepID=UPI003D6F5160
MSTAPDGARPAAAPPPAVEQAADLLAEAARTRVACPPVRTLFDGGGDLETAYAVQQLNVRRGLAAGRRIVGRKIGLTSVAVQRQLGVDRPDFGALFADMAVPDGGEVPTGRLIRPKVEAEVALVLGRDLPDPGCTAADVLRAVDFALPALEIVDSRIAGCISLVDTVADNASCGLFVRAPPPSTRPARRHARAGDRRQPHRISLVDTVADNASCGLFVLGATPVPLTAVDLRAVTMTMTRNGGTVSAGTGADCLGSPLNAAVWLASALAERGDPLRAGDLVLTGALGPMTPAAPGDVFEARIPGLGSAAVRFATEGDRT